MRKNVLITGVAGFIGRYVAEEALRRGYRVTGVDRNTVRTPGIEFVKTDIRDEERINQLARGKDLVVHLAAVTSNVEFIKSPADCYDTNVNGFMSVIDSAARNGCERFVYASSAAVYVDSFSEDTVIDFKEQGNHYAKSKIMNEMMAESYAHIFGMRTIGLRYFNVYGSGENDKGDYASIVTLFLKAKRNRDPLVVYGDGTQARDLIHVTNAAHATMDLLDRGSDRVYNIGTGVATPYRAIAEMIDKDHIRYVPNPLPNYQYFTQAHTARLRGVLGATYQFFELSEGMKHVKV